MMVNKSFIWRNIYITIGPVLLILAFFLFSGCSSDSKSGTPVSELFEDFNDNTSSGFSASQYFSIANNQLHFQGDNSNRITWTAWNGGPAPSHQWYADPGDSNYFDRFHLSVDTTFNGGDPSYLYGLIFCIREKSSINFMITNNSYYLITKSSNSGDKIIVNWKRTFLISPHTKENNLSIDKVGDHYRFRINGIEIENLTIPGNLGAYFDDGGAVGVVASLHVDVSFDNFMLTAPDEIISDFTTVAGQNQFVYRALKSSYYWYDKIAEADYNDFASPEDVLANLKYGEKDRWSYIVDQETQDNFISEGRYIGLGFNATLEGNDQFRVRYVVNDSPAYSAGLKRGDSITEINGITIAAIESEDLWDTVLPKDATGIDTTLKVTGTDGNVRVLEMESDWVTQDTIPYYDVIETPHLNIGYLVFNSFIERAEEDLLSVFDYFKDQHVDDLIIDLRYNPGGLGYIAQLLASLIKAPLTEDQVFARIQHNDRYSEWDRAYYFDNMEESLNLDRIVFITAGGTCSASELLIKGLTPFIDVTVIGSTTCGKPVGMYGYNFGDKYISCIEFKVSNAEGDSDYFEGIQPDCLAEDDLGHLFGDIQESSLQEAVYYLVNRACSQNASDKYKKARDIQGPLSSQSRLRGFRREIGAF